jgi:hypothetical protein
MPDEPPRPPPLVQFPLQDEAPGSLIYPSPDLTPPSPVHDPAPTFKRSIWILRLICAVVLIAVIIGLYMI